MDIEKQQNGRKAYSLVMMLFSLVVLSTLSWSDFTRDNDMNIVTDNSTGLQWQDDVNVSNKTWKQAIEYCEALTLGGYEDWRLPNFNELYFLADRTKSNPSIDNAFQNVLSYVYWSSTTVVDYEDYGWYVYFNFGYDRWGTKDNLSCVRCVRAGV